MARLVKTFGGQNLTGLDNDINAWFAANLDTVVLQVSVVGRDAVRSNGLDLGVAILYDTGAALGSPFVFNSLLASSMADMETQIAALIAAAPADFWQGPYIDNLIQARRRDDWFALMVTSSDGGAATNWTIGA